MSRSQRAPLSRRQARKAAARAAMRLAKTPEERKRAAFHPIMNERHPHGNRRTRLARSSNRELGEGWRRKKYIRGEYYGRRLEAVIRSRAPLHVVKRERIIIRALLAK